MENNTNLLPFVENSKESVKVGDYVARKKSNELRAYYNKTRDNWYVPFQIRDTETKEEKIHKKYFKTKEEANEGIKQFEYKKGNVIFMENNGIPLNKIMEYINNKKFKSGKEEIGQYGKNKRLIERITEAGIGNKEISEITANDIEDFFNTLSNYTESYINQWVSQFNQAFVYATKNKLIELNPMEDIDKPKSNKETKKVRPLEIDEQQKITEYLMNKTIKEEPYKNVFLIQMYMGLRIGEALALKRDDIDFKENVIQIKRTLKKDEKGRFYIGNSTKTPAGVRDIPIPQNIHKYIREQFENSNGNKENLLFLNENNNIVSPRNANAVLKRIVMQNLGVLDITTHSLRHTFGTRCIESKMSPVVVQRLMGHEKLDITMNTYVAILNKFKNEELKKLNHFYNDTNIWTSRDKKEQELDR